MELCLECLFFFFNKSSKTMLKLAKIFLLMGKMLGRSITSQHILHLK